MSEAQQLFCKFNVLQTVWLRNVPKMSINYYCTNKWKVRTCMYLATRRQTPSENTTPELNVVCPDAFLIDTTTTTTKTILSCGFLKATLPHLKYYSPLFFIIC